MTRGLEHAKPGNDLCIDTHRHRYVYPLSKALCTDISFHHCCIYNVNRVLRSLSIVNCITCPFFLIRVIRVEYSGAVLIEFTIFDQHIHMFNMLAFLSFFLVITHMCKDVFHFCAHGLSEKIDKFHGTKHSAI